MKTTLYCRAAFLGLAAAMTASSAGAVVSLWDNFDSYTSDAQVSAAGWNMTNTTTAVEDTTTWSF